MAGAWLIKSTIQNICKNRTKIIGAIWTERIENKAIWKAWKQRRQWGFV